MLVQYFIQSEGNKEPYAFRVSPSEQELTVGDIKSSFPCPGNYYLRFKTILQDQVPAMCVWLDGLDDFAPVPTFKDQIIVKALPVPPFDSKRLQKPPRKLYKESREVPFSPPQAPRKQSDFLFADDAHNRSHSAAPAAEPQRYTHTEPRKHEHSEPRKNNEYVEPKKRYVDPTDGLTTEQLKKREEERITKKVAEKTEDVKKMWKDEATLKQDKQDADREFREKINNWEARNHQKNNIRALLATMHTVLWPESGWEQIGAGELITPAQVKAAYFKSLNIIHPDKHQQDPPQIRYIAERIFGAVNEAFKLFRTNP